MNSVIIVVHNIPKRSEEILGMTDRCLQTLVSTADQEYELILIDNGSKDGGACRELLARYDPHGLASFTDENLPVSMVWNSAIAGAKGDNILLLNNDVIFNRSGWMSALTAPLLVGNNGASGGQKMSWHGIEFLEGAFLTFRRDLAYQVAENGKIFDEQFEFTCEEMDFCYRLQRAGLYLAETQIEHNGTATHLHHGTMSWSNEEGGWNGRSLMDIMHACRLKFCRKWGLSEQVDD